MDKIDVRMSQLIYTWGVGSVVPLPNGASGIIAGLDKWDNSDPNFQIHDDRLAKRLNLKGFRMPPYYVEKGKGANDSKKTIPTFIFPTWYYCPICHHVEKVGMGSTNVPPECPYCKAKNPKSRISMVPERFIVVCPEGHIDDLPILQLLHGHNFDVDGWMDKTSQIHHQHEITRYSSDKTSSVAGISYHCSCGAKFTMAEVIGTNKGRLAEAYNNRCPGTMPWLGTHKDKCSKPISELKVVQRGGTNVWYPITISSLFIPKSADACMAFVQTNMVKIKKILDMPDESDQREFISEFFGDAFSYEEIKANYLALEKGPETVLTESQYRYQEYKCMLQNYGGDNEDLYVSQVPTDSFSPSVSKLFSKIAKVKRLKETRALVGFSRLTPGMENIQTARQKLSISSLDWVPAVQVAGEGIFLEFNFEAIKKWSTTPEVIARETVLDSNYQKCTFHNQYFDRVTSLYVLIHTFAHIFINELSKECGYGSSSLRERIYVSEDDDTRMNGVLIYTSSGDSEGALGGLVRQADQDNFQYVLENAIKEAAWCSSDPVCINSQGQGPDSCNLSACFSCALLPETCCETGNRFLDRGMLVGNPSKNEHFGFFDELLKE